MWRTWGISKLSSSELLDTPRRTRTAGVLASRIQATLIEDFPTVNVSVKDGTAFVSIEGTLSQQEKRVSQARSVIRNIEGVKGVRVHFVPLVVAD